MLAKTIEYTDYNGVERKETFYFNLNETELTSMDLENNNDLAGLLQRIIDAKDTPKIVECFKEIIRKSYGVKSDDGRRFIKNEQVFNEFAQTEAYNKLFMELATDDKAGAAFVNGIIPKAIQGQVAKQIAEQGGSLPFKSVN
jgi:hypothetical protein